MHSVSKRYLLASGMLRRHLEYAFQFELSSFDMAITLPALKDFTRHHLSEAVLATSHRPEPFQPHLVRFPGDVSPAVVAAFGHLRAFAAQSSLSRCQSMSDLPCNMIIHCCEAGMAKRALHILLLVWNVRRLRRHVQTATKVAGAVSRRAVMAQTSCKEQVMPSTLLRRLMSIVVVSFS